MSATTVRGHGASEMVPKRTRKGPYILERVFDHHGMTHSAWETARRTLCFVVIDIIGEPIDLAVPPECMKCAFAEREIQLRRNLA